MKIIYSRCDGYNNIEQKNTHTVKNMLRASVTVADQCKTFHPSSFLLVCLLLIGVVLYFSLTTWTFRIYSFEYTAILRDDLVFLYLPSSKCICTLSLNLFFQNRTWMRVMTTIQHKFNKYDWNFILFADVGFSCFSYFDSIEGSVHYINYQHVVLYINLGYNWMCCFRRECMCL